MRTSLFYQAREEALLLPWTTRLGRQIRAGRRRQASVVFLVNSIRGGLRQRGLPMMGDEDIENKP